MNEKPTAKSNRPYVVLEEKDLGGIVRGMLASETDLDNGRLTAIAEAFGGAKVYREVLRADARNSDHALKQAGQVVEVGTPDLIPVPLRYFQAQTVDASDERQVKVGGR